MKRKIIRNFICNKLFPGALLMLLLQTEIAIFFPNVHGRPWDILREKLVQRILKYRDSFFKNTDTGEWILVFNDDIKTIESFLENSMMQILSGVLTALGIIIAMFYENKWIAIFFSVYVLISVGYIIQMQKKKTVLSGKRTQQKIRIHQLLL